jgi:hypothetical protein
LKERIAKRGWSREVVYDESRWKLLDEKRRVAKRVLNLATKMSASSILHGSVARGDVHKDSDVDVVMPEPIPPFLIETELEKEGFNVYDRYVVQATPSSIPKLYYSLDPLGLVTLSTPLGRFTTTEYEFYLFGGWLDLRGLEEGKRVPGVDKRLLLITPTLKGHKEESVLGKEEYVAKLLGVSLQTVNERVRVLLRRGRHGRTGVFLEYHIPPLQSTERAIELLKEENRVFKKALEGSS